MVPPRPGERLDSDDVREVLNALGELRALVDEREPSAVARARADGISWQEIPSLLRRATSSVFERYRDL